MFLELVKDGQGFLRTIAVRAFWVMLYANDHAADEQECQNQHSNHSFAPIDALRFPWGSLRLSVSLRSAPLPLTINQMKHLTVINRP
jgi:hypothetical protein